MEKLRIKSINRKKEVTLEVNGRKIKAYQGEKVLAALIAAGYKELKKNPVSGEPRGALCGMGVCFECTVTINGVPNIRSCMTEVRDGMKIEINEQE